MSDQVPADVMEARRQELMAAQQDVHFARNAAKVGRELDVLVEEHDLMRKIATGRGEHDAPDVDGQVRIHGVEAARPGAIIRTRITEADGYDLIGEPVSPT